MLNDQKVTKRLWGEAMHTSNSLGHICPVVGQFMAPWEMFQGSQPDASRSHGLGKPAVAFLGMQRRWQQAM
jgi:hypothetical protein